MKEFGDEATGKWIHLERNILHRVWAISEEEGEPQNMTWLVFNS